MPTPTESENVHPIYTVKLWKQGASNTVPLYAAVMAAIGARPGDLLMVRVHPPYVTLRVARPEKMVPIDTFGPEMLPPSWPGKEDNATTPDDTSRPVAPTPRATARKHE
jgi:hypothetical protein